MCKKTCDFVGKYCGLIFLLLFYTIVLAIAYFNVKSDAIQTLAIVLTGAIILWYSWETKLLKEATYAQREIQIRPFVVVDLRKNIFYVTNVGVGTALNVQIREVVIPESHLSISFARLVTLEPYKETVCPHSTSEILSPGKKRALDENFLLSVYLNPNYAVLTLKIVIDFQNIEKKFFSETMQVSPGKFEIL